MNWSDQQNSGLNFSLRTNSPNILGWDWDGSDVGSQYWYDLVMTVNPNDADEIYTGGINIWKSTDGGSNMTLTAHWVGSGGADDVHADQHALEFSPHNNDLYSGNDGGIYYSSNSGSNWTDITSGLAIAQVYKVGISQSVKDLAINGYQDNGTAVNEGTTFRTEIGGDGMECIIDPADANYMYGSLYYGAIRRSSNYGFNFGNIVGGISEQGGWVTPFKLDPANASRMYAGFDNVWRTNNVKAGTVAWTQISSFGGTTNCVDLAVAPSNTNVIYVSRSYGEFYRTGNAQAGSVTWTDLSTNLPSTSTPKDIEIDPTDPDHLFIAVGVNIYESTDGGVNWTDFSGTLRNVSLNSIIIDENSPVLGMYVGMDVGVYYRDINSTDWEQFYSGLPNVEVTELEIYYNTTDCESTIYGSTFAQGLWKSDLKDPGTVAPIACFESDVQIGCTATPITFTDLSSYTPTSWTWTFSPNTVTFVNSTTANSETPEVEFNATGLYSVTLTATNANGSGIETKTDYISIINSVLSTPTLTAPADVATGVAIPTSFSWSVVAGTNITYDLDIATDAAFTSIVDAQTGLSATAYSSTGLSSNTTYYWRVKAFENCAESPFTSTFSFTTGNCTANASTDVPVVISASGTPTVTSTLTVGAAGTISSITVSSLVISHTWVNDLTITLTSPDGTTINLIDQICGGEDDINVILEDAATTTITAAPCPPVGGNNYQPDGTLASFIGENAAGIWTLTVTDHVNQDGGTIDDWSLGICTNPVCTDPTIPSLSFDTDPICPGGSTTNLNFSGTLNDATAWHVYSTSCGTGAVGNAATGSITVSPTTTTTYYVRGEGGCVTPGSCASEILTVADNTNPTISCPSNTTENANSSCQVSLPDYTGSATAADNCTGSPTVTQSPAATTLITGVGTVQTVTLTATDGSSNTAGCTFNVTVADNIDPVVTCPSITEINPSATCGMPDLTGGASVSDNCDPSPVIISQSPAVSASMASLIGTNQTLTITATDATGNTGSCSVVLPVVDNTPPSITCPSNTTENANGTCQIALPNYAGAATISDGCDGAPIISSQSPGAGAIIIGVGTVQTITLTVADASSNTANCSFNVTIVDNTGPSITCPGNVTTTANPATCTASPALGSPTTGDNCSVASTVNDAPANFPVGNTTVTWTVTDGSSNSNSCTHQVSVSDNTPAQPGTISGTAVVCSGENETYSITAVSGATGYTWTLPTGWTGSSSTNSITVVTGPNAGNITVSADNSCGSSAAQTLAVSLQTSPSQPGTISGDANACAGTVELYSITSVTGATSYIWTLPSGWSGSSTSTSISATVGSNSGTISVTAVGSCGNSTSQTLAVNPVNAPAQPAAISGLSPACPNSSQTYSVPAVVGAVAYSWNLPSGWTGTSTTNSITVSTTNTGGTISVSAVDACGQNGVDRTLAIGIISIDDGVPCTADACNPANGTVTNTPNDALCDDGLWCNGQETCDAVLGCQAGTAPALDDGNGCTDDSCDEVIDQVIHSFNTAPCDDGDPLTTNDQCLNGVCVGIAIGNVWTGNVNSTWGVSGNWSMFIPTSSDDGIIPTTPIGGVFPQIPFGYLADIDNIQVQSGATVTVLTGGTLNVFGILTNDGTINVNNSGSLVQQTGSTLAGSGTYNVQRQGSNGPGYNYWSSPITTHSSVPGTSYSFNSNLSTQDDSDDTTPYDPGWISYNGVMNPGSGYAGLAGGLVTFSGSVSNGNINTPLTYHAFDNTYSQTSPGTPFNLVGNPYPSAISAAQLVAANVDIDGTLYFWDDDNSGGSDYLRADYAYWNGTGALGTGSGNVGAPNGFVSTGQGFYVRSLNGSAVLNFNNSLRVPAQNDQFFRMNGADSRLWFSIERDSLFNQVLIGMLEDATIEEDRLYDAVKMHAPNGLSLAAMANSTEHAIMAFPPPAEVQTVPLLVNVNENGNYTFKANTMEEFAGYQVYFNDVVENTNVLLHEGSSINVFLHEGEYENRFFLNFYPSTITGVTSAGETAFSVYSNNSILHLQLIGIVNQSVLVEILDMRGKVIRSFGNLVFQNGKASISSLGISAGVYVVKATTDKGIFAQKIVLK